MSLVQTLRFARLVIASGALAVPGVGLTGEQTGTVTKVSVRQSDGLTLFHMSGTASGKPACASHQYWMIKDENSETGKRQLSMLLAAQLTGSQVVVKGLGTCTRWGDGEDVESVEITT